MLYRVKQQGWYMNSDDRRRIRYERRKAGRDRKKQEKIGEYDDYSHMTDADKLYASYKLCRHNVNWKESTQRYEANAMRNILDAQKKLIARESVQSGFVEFDLYERGKARHIRSIHISERVVQKCLCDNILVPILSRPLIYDNGATMKGKGVHFSIRRLIAHLSKFYKNNGFSNKGYVLVIDFKRFFDNIRHDILLKMLNDHVADPDVRELLRRFVIVFGKNRSLGLGSQISQICAIFYPSKLDHFIKETLRVKFYGRYMDDLYLIHRSKAYLEECLKKIHAVCDDLDITINERKTRIIPLREGFRFLKGKYSLTETGRIIRRASRDSAARMRRKLRKFKGLLGAGRMRYEDIRSSYQAWRNGYMKRFDDFYKICRIDRLYDELFIK
jgi:retron-type reverse transcriptase